MAIYHYSAQIIKRSAGRSSVAAAAYRAGEKIIDERTGLIHDYTRKTGVIYSEIMAPNNAPKWVYNRAELWNQVEFAEKRVDSQTAREINVALPVELSVEQNIKLLRGYVKENFVDRGMIADITIHYDNPQNPHAHIMLTTREITPDGFGKKCREWNPDFAYGKVKQANSLVDWRESWQIHANRALENAGFEIRIDHRSYAEQGIDKLATIHEGPHVRAMEKKGIETEIGNINREIIKANSELSEIKYAQVVNLAKYRQAKQEYEREIEGWKYYNSRERAAVQRVQEIIEPKEVTIENLEQHLKELAIKQRSLSNLEERENLNKEAKDIRRAIAALKSVELKEFTANNSDWPAARYLEYNEMKFIKLAAENITDQITSERIKQEYDTLLETIDEDRSVLNIYRKEIDSIRLGRIAFEEYKQVKEELKNTDTFINKLKNREVTIAKINSLNIRSEQLLLQMNKYGITNIDEYKNAEFRLSMLSENEKRLSEKLDRDLERRRILSKALQAINNANFREEIIKKVVAINPNFKHPDISGEDLKILGEKLYNISQQIEYRDRFKNIKYLPEPLKKELYELADWTLARPEIKKIIDEYMTIQRGLIENQYTNIARSSLVENNLNKAYKIIRDRVAHELKNQAVAMINIEEKEKIIPPAIIPKHVPYVVNAFRNALQAPRDIEEIKWTFKTSVWVLKEMGVTKEENYKIISDWVNRSNIEISGERIKEVIDHFYAKERGSWLGRDNWERLFTNLGVNVPPNPWNFESNSINYANIAWKAIFRSIQQEKVKAEVQGRLEQEKRSKSKSEKREREERDR